MVPVKALYGRPDAICRRGCLICLINKEIKQKTGGENDNNASNDGHKLTSNFAISHLVVKNGSPLGNQKMAFQRSNRPVLSYRISQWVVLTIATAGAPLGALRWQRRSGMGGGTMGYKNCLSC